MNYVGSIRHQMSEMSFLTSHKGRIKNATPPSGFPRINRERMSRSSQNLVNLTFKQLYIFPANFKTVPTLDFDLWPDFQGDVKRNLRSVPSRRLKLAIFGIFAGDMNMNRYCELTSMYHCQLSLYCVTCHLYCDLSEVNRGHPRSMIFDYVLCYFQVFVPQGNLMYWFFFKFGIPFSFICVEIGSLR